MADRPSKVPTWATSGTKVDPGSGKSASGWNVEEKPPAQYLNWLQSFNGSWIEYLREQTLVQAAFSLRPTTGSNDMDSVKKIIYVEDVDGWFAFGNKPGSPDTKALKYMHEDLLELQWKSATAFAVNTGAASYSFVMASNGSEMLLNGDNGTPMHKIADISRAAMASPTISAVTSLTNIPLDMVWFEKEGLYVAAVNDGTNGVETSDDSGATWNQQTVPALKALATDGNTLVGLENTASGVDIYSSSDGASWTVRHTTTGFCNSLHYSPSVGFISHDNGEIIYSDDGGITWLTLYAGVSGALPLRIASLGDIVVFLDQSSNTDNLSMLRAAGIDTVMLGQSINNYVGGTNPSAQVLSNDKRLILVADDTFFHTMKF